ncbi:4a-hydroxytetrahydrobiopterin dehydratase [Sarracenia purpurea var. burkii]
MLIAWVHENGSLLTMSDLSAKKCVPCNSKDMRPMTEQAANELIRQVPEWNLANEGGTMKLSRSWKVKTFLKGLEFIQAVANVAEAEVYLIWLPLQALANFVGTSDILGHLVLELL